jgi:protein SCO1
MIRCLPVLVLALVLFGAPTASAEPPGARAPVPFSSARGRPAPVPPAGVDPRIGDRVPRHLAFTDDAGARVEIGRYLGGRPLVLALVYYGCPMLCTEVLNGLVSSLKVVGLAPGEDFDVVAVSIDPSERPELAAEKKKAYVARYGDPRAKAGIHFLTGAAGPIGELARAVGFRYEYDPETRLFAHAAAIMVITGDGTIARYFHGIEYPPRDLRLALVEASQGRVGTAGDRLLLLCYQYDPTTGKYGATTMTAVRFGGVVTTLALLSFIVLGSRRERRAGGAHP